MNAIFAIFTLPAVSSKTAKGQTPFAAGMIARALRVAFVLALVCGAAPAQAQWFSTTIAPPDFWTASSLNDVSNDGRTAAGYCNAGGIDQGLLATRSISYNIFSSQNIGKPAGWFTNAAWGIDATGDRGVGFGLTVTGGFPPDLVIRATYTGPETGQALQGWVGLPMFPGYQVSEARGISLDGQVIVGYMSFFGFPDAVRWTGGYPQSFTLLPALPNQSGNQALAVSDDGTTTVGQSGTRACKWTGNGMPVDLGSLPGMVSAVANGVNHDGSVVVGIWNDGVDRGFYWTQATGMVNIPPLPTGTIVRPRTCSNANGTLVIVGQAGDSNAPGGLNGFAWTQMLGTQPIVSHLVDRGLFLAIPTMTITDVRAISPDSRQMCGVGVQNGQNVGWLASQLLCATLTGLPTTRYGCQGSEVTIFPYGDVGGGGFVSGTSRYQWYRNGVPMVAGTQPGGSFIISPNDFTLTIFNLTPSDVAQYHCVASSGGACVVTGPVSQVSLAVPQINLEPVDTVGCVGQSVQLVTAATTPIGTPQYRWQKRVPPTPNVYLDILDGPTGNGSTYSGTGTSMLTINNAQPGDSERYRCIITISQCGALTSESTYRALVSVVSETMIVSDPLPTSQCLGDNDAFFSVTASPSGAGLTYQWTKRQPPFPNVYVDIFDGPTGNGGNYGGTQTPNLTIAGVYAGDFDRYRCRVMGPCGFTQTSANALLSAIPAGMVVTGPDSNSACLGGVGTLSVTATPAGSTYQWKRYSNDFSTYLNVSNGPTGNGGTYSGAQSPTLSVNILTLADTQSYFHCEVTGPCGGLPALSADSSIVPLVSPPQFLTLPATGSVCITGTKQLSVSLVPQNYGSVNYQWWRYVSAFPIFAQVPNGVLPSGAVISGAQTSVMTISNFQPQDAGQYYCQVITDCTQAPSTEATLSVCIADADCNGAVDILDLLNFNALWSANLGQSVVPYTNGDANGDGFVDLLDLLAFNAEWNTNVGGGCP